MDQDSFVCGLAPVQVGMTTFVLQEKACVVTLVRCANAALRARDGSFRLLRSLAGGSGKQAQHCCWRLHVVQQEQYKQVRVLF